MGTRQFESGAVRSDDADDLRYDLISPIALRRLAATYKEGADKYSDYNWQKGIPASNLINHLMGHLEKWRTGDTSEDHLGHALWNLATLVHFEEMRPDLIDVKYREERGELPSRDWHERHITGDEPSEYTPMPSEFSPDDRPHKRGGEKPVAYQSAVTPEVGQRMEQSRIAAGGKPHDQDGEASAGVAETGGLAQAGVSAR